MIRPSTTIHCPEFSCQTVNPEESRFCQQCGRLLPKRYLWATQTPLPPTPDGLVGGRYYAKTPRILLDSLPGLPPISPAEVTPPLLPYLRLFPYRPQIPCVYGILAIAHEQSFIEVPLLEQAPLQPNLDSDRDQDWLLPSLVERWEQATAMRQLNWLWQIAHLWEPLRQQGVAQTLLNPDLLRVEGSILRILELQFDSEPLTSEALQPNAGQLYGSPTLADLGRLWRSWQPHCRPEISFSLEKLCDQLQQQEVHTAEQLITLLDVSLRHCSQFQSRQTHVTTLTDQGPSRQRNEDACYPDSGSDQTQGVPISPMTMTIVCDGIGGHEGGQEASHLAIEAIQRQLQSLMINANPCEPSRLIAQLANSLCVANDLINQRNDSEHRQDRKRMGTTVVMAVSQGHELYLAHIGDSRAYRITRSGCYQITLDDDIASREVRLGYSLYRDALHGYASGTLVQALGTNSSANLHPNVKRLVIDEDCLFLLCSDGLSDNDLVDELWLTEIVPVLDDQVELKTVAQRLVEIANQRNGHDNVTVALAHFQVRSLKSEQTLLQASPSKLRTQTVQATRPLAGRSMLNTSRSGHHSGSRLFAFCLLFPLFLSGSAALTYFLLPELRAWIALQLGQLNLTPDVATAPAPVSPEVTVSPNNATLTTLQPGTFLQVKPATQRVNLYAQPGNPTPIPGSLKAGDVVKILQIDRSSVSGIWLQVTVCRESSLASPAPMMPVGWLPETLLVQDLVVVATTTCRD